jgi:hypothetical protein
MASPLFDQFAGLVNSAIALDDGDALRRLLPIEPPFSSDYDTLLDEVFAVFDSTDALKEYVRGAIDVIAADDNDAWHAFADFLATYFDFIHDVDLENLLHAYENLANLLTKCAAALQNDPHGVLILPTALEYAKVLGRLAIGLDKRPDLIAHIAVTDDGPATSLPERAAMNLRSILGICARDAKPHGKSDAVYKMAILCFKILFQCDKTDSLPTFYNIVAQARRPITSYPRCQRVAYLYYLGRYFFSTSQFYCAMLTLDAAYLECHTALAKQRRLMLVYLTTASIICGRFPNDALYSRSEAAGFRAAFAPVCRAIALGDLAAFRAATDGDAPSAALLVRYRVLLQLRGHCEAVVWRSLARRVFHATRPTEEQADKAASTLALADLAACARALIVRATGPPLLRADAGVPGRRHANWLFVSVDESAVPPVEADPEFEGLDEDEVPVERDLPEDDEVEGIVTSLVAQDLMVGYVARRAGKFAVLTGRNKPALEAGWPCVAEVLRERLGSEAVPGWKREEGEGGGMVLHLSSAAAAGS